MPKRLSHEAGPSSAEPGHAAESRIASNNVAKRRKIEPKLPKGPVVVSSNWAALQKVRTEAGRSVD